MEDTYVRIFLPVLGVALMLSLVLAIGVVSMLLWHAASYAISEMRKYIRISITFPTLMLLAGVLIMLIVGYQLTTIATEEDEVIRIDDTYTGETPCYVSNGHEYCTGLIP